MQTMADDLHASAPANAGVGARLVRLRGLPIGLGLLSACLLGHVIDGGFQLDDLYQRAQLVGGDSIDLFVFFDGTPETTRSLIEEGVLPWWTVESLRHAPFRYLSVLTMQVDFALWPTHPEWMHLHSLFWLILLVASVASLYRTLIAVPAVAALAGCLYAVDEALATPTAYLANRNALIAVGFGVLAIVAHDQWRRVGAVKWALMSAAFLALALSAGEMALGALAYLAAYAVCLDRDDLRGRLVSLVPASVVVAGWASVYSLGGFGAENTDLYLDPLVDPLAFGKTVLGRVPVMVTALWTSLPADVLSVALGTQHGRAVQLACWVGALAFAAALLPLLRRDRVARFWALGATFSLLPISASLPQTRLLLFAAVGALALVAQFAWDLLSSSEHATRLPKWAARSVVGALAIAHLLVAPAMGWVQVDFWKGVSARVDRAIASVPADAAIAGQDLIVVNAPDVAWMVGAIPSVREVEGRPSPARLRALFTGTTRSRLERPDARTLVVTLGEGLFPNLMSRYYRSRDHAFAVADRVSLTGLDVEVLAVDAEGSPKRLAFRFAVPLEDPSLRWLRYVDGAFVAWEVPDIGEAMELEAAPGIFEPS